MYLLRVLSPYVLLGPLGVNFVARTSLREGYLVTTHGNEVKI